MPACILQVRSNEHPKRRVIGLGGRNSTLPLRDSAGLVHQNVTGLPPLCAAHPGIRRTQSETDSIVRASISRSTPLCQLHRSNHPNPTSKGSPSSCPGPHFAPSFPSTPYGPFLSALSHTHTIPPPAIPKIHLNPANSDPNSPQCTRSCALVLCLGRDISGPVQPVNCHRRPSSRTTRYNRISGETVNDKIPLQRNQEGRQPLSGKRPRRRRSVEHAEIFCLAGKMIQSADAL